MVRYEPDRVQPTDQTARPALRRSVAERAVGARPGGVSPPADVEETEDAYVIELDLPGVDKKDIDIEVSGRRLVVQGERKEKERVGMLRRQTRTVGRFRYEVMLPEQVNGDEIDASMDGGVLRLRVPKQKDGQRRRVEVK